MARLIDAKFAQHIANAELSPDTAGTVQWVLSHTPTVDAVEVVRCRDCKYWKPSGSKAGNSFANMEYIGGCEFTNYCRRESDFCSYGERKDGDGNG